MPAAARSKSIRDEVLSLIEPNTVNHHDASENKKKPLSSSSSAKGQAAPEKTANSKKRKSTAADDDTSTNNDDSTGDNPSSSSSSSSSPPPPPPPSKKRNTNKSTSSLSTTTTTTTADDKKKKNNNNNNNNKKPKTAADKKAAAEALLDVSGIRLPGENDDDDDDDDNETKVPVYETCRTMRAKIRAFLKRDGVSKAAFARAIGERNADRLSRFLDKSKGVMSQNANPVFYQSYVFLEKVRIRDGQAKSKFRKEMEEVHGDRGVEVESNLDGPFIAHASETIHIDQYGTLHIERNGKEIDTA